MRKGRKFLVVAMVVALTLGAIVPLAIGANTAPDPANPAANASAPVQSPAGSVLTTTNEMPSRNAADYGNSTNGFNSMYNVYYNGLVYYFDDKAGGIWQIKPDGTGKKCLSAHPAATCSMRKVFALDGWIYYGFDTRTRFETTGWYRMRTDGSKRALIAKAATYAKDITIIDITRQWLYYTEGPGNCFGLCRMKPDGSGPQQLLPRSYHYDRGWVAGDWFYFSEKVPDRVANNLSRVKLDNTGYQVLVKDIRPNIAVEGSWVYYDAAGGSFPNAIWRVCTDGSQNQKIIANISPYLGINSYNVSSDWIYYTLLVKGGMKHLYRVEPDGSGCSKILEDKKFFGLLQAGDRIFICDGDAPPDHTSVYIVNPQTKKKTTLYRH